MRDPQGTISLLIGGGTPQTVRLAQTYFTNLPVGSWYHIASVGTGPGNPVTLYLTPVSATTVSAMQSTTTLQGPNGNYPTDAAHDLTIGSRNTPSIPLQSLKGDMVNQAIYNRALSPVEIQELFQYGKAQTYVNNLWQNKVLVHDVDGNGVIQPLDLLLVVNRLLTSGTGPLPAPSGNKPPPYLDVTGNGSVEPLDALTIVNWLLLHPDGGGPGSPGSGGGGGGGTATMVASAENDSADDAVDALTASLDAGPTGASVVNTFATSGPPAEVAAQPVVQVFALAAPADSPSGISAAPIGQVVSDSEPAPNRPLLPRSCQ